MKTIRDYANKCIELTNVASKDIMSLNNEPFFSDLISIWKHIRVNCEKIFKKSSDNYLTKLNNYPKVNFHTCIDMSHSFTAEENTLNFNILTLFFRFTPEDNGRIIFNPPFLQAGMLLHELDHYQYYMDADMIYKPNHVTKTYYDDNLRDIETRAYLRENNFYTQIKRKLEEKECVLGWQKDYIAINEPMCFFILEISPQQLLDQLIKYNTDILKKLTIDDYHYGENKKCLIKYITSIGNYFSMTYTTSKVDFKKINNIPYKNM